MQEAAMRALVVFESMYGSTHTIADSIAEGLRPALEVQVVRAADAGAMDVGGYDLLVIGAPTHVHGLPRASTRQGAEKTATKPESDVVLEPGAASQPGVREWLATLGAHPRQRVAVFDTRLKGPKVITGRASKAIARSVSKRGLKLVEPPTSFIVDKESHLFPGEAERARFFGVHLGSLLHEARAA
jgi:hypothetical protein